ncbi:unnamed protein product [Linum tenue]|uniref:VQ domain-containing protein n=1 Tax=Linum tenue TaxID=586396 RepID=A0AAV0QVK2_9ROSI|nr:unnamed protein product [Linum tenue]
MDRQSSVDSYSSSGGGSYHNHHHHSRDHYLKNLNKQSQKISKPSIPSNPRKLSPSPFDHHHQQSNPPNPNPNPNPNPPPTQNQPHVYNINKNDFRDVVQRLTGSPAHHDRFSSPNPPPPASKPPSQVSRLQRIRPPPLAGLAPNRPPIQHHRPMPPQQHYLPPPGPPPPNSFFPRPPPGPLSPVPQFPGPPVAESPVSAYMRYLQDSMDPNKQHFTGFSPLAPLVSPRWNNLQQQDQLHFGPPPPPQQQHHHQGLLPSPNAAPSPFQQFPQSPLSFGFLNSPRSPYPLFSPAFPLSPTMPVHSPRWLLSPNPFPLSPTMPFPSPRWRGM